MPQEQKTQSIRPLSPTAFSSAAAGRVEAGKMAEAAVVDEAAGAAAHDMYNPEQPDDSSLPAC